MKRVILASLFLACFLGFSTKASAQCTGTPITGFTVTNVDDVSCFGGSDGQIEVTLVGGQAPFTYSLVIATGSGDIPIASIPNTNSQVVTFTGLFANAPVGGTYKVALVTSNGGTPLITCKNRVISSIDVDEPTVLTASVASVTSSCAPNSGAISLNVAGGTPGYTYAWSGTTAIASNVEDPTGLAGGTYSVSVRDANYNAGNPGFCEVILSNIIIVDPASISLTSTNTSTCFSAGVSTANLSYTSTTGSPDQYSIDFNAAANGAGFVDLVNTALTASPIVITVPGAAPAAVYSGNLTVRNSTSGCISSVSAITVTVVANPSITLGGSPTVCSGVTSANLTYSATSGSPDQYSIDFNAAANGAGFVDLVNTALTASPIVITVPGAAPAAVYSGNLTVRNSTSGCISSVSAITVTIVANPSITLGGSPTVCSGVTSANLTYSATSGSPDQYSIDFNGAANGAGFVDLVNTALTASPIVITVPGAAPAAVYSGNLTVRNSTSGCISSVSAITVTVVANPSITLGGSPTVCSGVTSANLTYSATSGSPDQYSIDFNGAANGAGFVDLVNTALTASPIVITVPGAAPAAVYSGNLTVRNSTSGCISSVSAITVTVVANPSITLGGSPTVCSGVTSANLTYSATSGSPDQYSIDFNGAANGAGFVDLVNTALTASPIVITVPGAAPAAVYSGNLTVRNSTSGCISSVSAITVTVVANPSITLGGSPTVCSGVTSANLTYSATSGSPDQYSIDFNGAANGAGFVDLVNTALTASPIVITVPGAAPAAVYSGNLTVRNSTSGCISSVSAITVTVVANPSITLGGSPTVCSGVTSANLTYSATSGSPDQYSIDFNGAANGAGFVDLVNTALTASPIVITVPGAAPAAVYSGNLTVRNSTSGCISSVSAITVTVVANPSITLGGSPTVCSGVTSANLTYSATSGSPDQYSIDFNGAANGAGFVDLVNAALTASPIVITVPGAAPAAVYSGNLTVRNSTSGCISSVSSITVSINSNPSYNALVTDVTTCPPGNDGTITVNAFGGSGAGYTYSKDNGSTFQGANLFSSLTPGNYLVVVKDGAGCVSLATNVTVGSPSSLTFTFTQQNVLCNGGNSGSMTITPSGGSGSYTYSNDNGITFPGSGANFTFTTLTAATYPVVVKDTGTGCQFSSSIIITQPALVSFSNVKTDATCNGVSDGTITVTASGGNSVYTYSNDNGATFQASNVFSSLPVATYQVIVKDGNNCLSAASGITIGQPTVITFTDVSTDPTTCNPGNDGTITITAAGGNGTYQYSNDNGATFQVSNAFTGLVAGSYQVIVKDVNDCLSAASAVSLIAPGGVTFTNVEQDVTCNGGTDGSITLTTSGGNGSYTYSKDNGVTFAGSGSPFTFNSLAAGTYQVVAEDGNGCQFSSSIAISEPVLVTFTTVDVNVTCNGNSNGSITITASGGNSSYQYSKDNGVTFQVGSSFSSLVAGAYQIVVKDGNNCASVATPITITEPALVNATFSGLAGSYCTSSGVVNLNATTGGGTFTGPGISGTTFSPATAGVGTHTIQYSVTSSGCSNTTTQTVDVISSVVDGSFIGLNPTYCLSSIVVTLTPATSGGTFSGSGISGNTFNPSTAGSGIHTIQYSVISGGCTSTTSQSVNVLLSTDPICTSGTGTGTCATVVIVPKPSPATCTSSDGKIVFSIKPFVPIINTTGVKIDIQGISSTNLGVSRTNFNDSTFLNLPFGTYDFTIEYGEATCIKTGQVTIGQSGTVGSPVASNIVRPLCFGEATGSLTLDVPGETGNLLEWSLDGNTWTPFTAGSVITGVPTGSAPLFDRVISVRRNSSDLCNAAVLIIIQEINPAITASIVPSDATCSNNDGLLTLSGIGGGSGVGNFTYKLNGADLILPADNVIRGLSAGTHTFSIVDNIGCQKDLTPVDVNFPGYVNYTTPVATAPDCAGTGSNGSIVFQITDIGSFQVGYTSDAVAEPTNYVDPAGAPIIISNLSNGNYFIWIKPSGAQCATKLSPVSINGVFPLSFTSTTTNILCFGNTGEIRLNAINGAPNLDLGFELIKDGVTSSGSITVTQSLGEFIIPDLTLGNYQLRLTQDQSTIVPSCTLPITSLYQNISITGPTEALDTLYVNRLISVPDLPTGSMLVGIKESEQEPYEVMLELMNPLFVGQEFVMDWTTAIFNTQNLKIELAIKNLFAGDYKMSLRDGLGCIKEYDVTLDVDTNIAVPNVFTPNGDGFNDVFFIRNLPADANLIIANRWGKEVYASEKYQNNWGGGDISDGVYFYRLNFSGQSLTGWVEILRGK